MPGTLYLVPTPIGNLGDISSRMAETLETVDFIAAEDTRVTVKLLNHLGIKKPMVSYYRHNTDTSGAAVLDVYKRQAMGWPPSGSTSPIPPCGRNSTPMRTSSCACAHWELSLIHI